MAYIKYKTGDKKLITNDMAIAIWRVLHGYVDADTPEQQRFVRSVDEVSLNWMSAPDDYIKHNFSIIAPEMIGRWRVDMFGRPSRPEYGTDLHIAERWGLWARGKPTALAVDIIKHMKAPRTRQPVQTTLV